MPKPMSIRIQIPEPCNEPWGEMQANHCGRFCQSCQKTVIDFSVLSDNAVAHIITHSSGAICGRFDASQLNRNIIAAEPPSNKALFSFSGKIAASFLLLQTLVSNVFAQSKSVPSTEQLSPSAAAQKDTIILNGTIIDNTTQQPLVGMEISIDELNYVKYSDAKGRFRFVLPETFRGKTIFVNAAYTKNGSAEVPETQIRKRVIEIHKHDVAVAFQMVRYPFTKMQQIEINSPPPVTVTGGAYYSGDMVTTINEPKKHGLINWIKNLFSKKK